MIRTIVRRRLVLTLFSVVALLFSVNGLSANPPGGGGPRKSTIVGEVVGAGGPIAGASVLLFDSVSIDQIAETFTDANGNFQFRRLRAGTYSVTALSIDPLCWGSTAVTVAPRETVVVVVACQ